MCFSAEASFIGGSVLTTIGILSVRKNREPEQRLFAAMPLVFGIQQIAEGFVWTALESEQKDLMLKLSAYTFLAVALLIWPSFVPLSIRLMETDRRRKPFLITSKRRVWLLGAVVVVSYAVAAYFYSEYLLSVWCFFAALTSVVVWWIVGEARVTSRQQVQVSQ